LRQLRQNTKSDHYKTVHDFLEAANLVVNNSIAFNGPRALITTAARNVLRAGEESLIRNGVLNAHSELVDVPPPLPPPPPPPPQPAEAAASKGSRLPLKM